MFELAKYTKNPRILHYVAAHVCKQWRWCSKGKNLPRGKFTKLHWSLIGKCNSLKCRASQVGYKPRAGASGSSILLTPIVSESFCWLRYLLRELWLKVWDWIQFNNSRRLTDKQWCLLVNKPLQFYPFQCILTKFRSRIYKRFISPPQSSGTEVTWQWEETRLTKTSPVFAWRWFSTESIDTELPGTGVLCPRSRSGRGAEEAESKHVLNSFPKLLLLKVVFLHIIFVIWVYVQ